MAVLKLGAGYRCGMFKFGMKFFFCFEGWDATSRLVVLRVGGYSSGDSFKAGIRLLGWQF